MGIAPFSSPSRAPASAPSPRPSRIRFAVFVFCGVYPLVTGLLYLLVPLTEG